MPSIHLITISFWAFLVWAFLVLGLSDPDSLKDTGMLIFKIISTQENKNKKCQALLNQSVYCCVVLQIGSSHDKVTWSTIQSPTVKCKIYFCPVCFKSCINNSASFKKNF